MENKYFAFNNDKNEMSSIIKKEAIQVVTLHDDCSKVWLRGMNLPIELKREIGEYIIKKLMEE